MVKDGFITPKKRPGRSDRAHRWAQSQIEEIDRELRVQACCKQCLQACREECLRACRKECLRACRKIK